MAHAKHGVAVWMSVAVLALTLAVGGGCGKSAAVGLSIRPTEVRLPLWFTMPSAEDQRDVPVSLDVNLPSHLQPLAKQFGLPNWVIYGVVRGLGAREFMANGTIRSFSVVDEQGESQVVIDDLYYDVPMDQARQTLKSIARECSIAETERERLDVLGSFVHRRHGSLILFSLERKTDMKTNLLLTSGKSDDPVETFVAGCPGIMPTIGWKESGGKTTTTMVGSFHYGNAELSFRRTEEEAIRDLAKGLMFKFSHMDKSYIEGGVHVSDDVKEEVSREDIRLRMRGVKVQRRVVNMERGLCLVEVSVPIGGVARQ